MDNTSDRGRHVGEHVIDASRVHHRWDRALEPTLEIASGDIVHFELLMSGHGQVDWGSPVEDVRFDFDTLYNLAGPVFVDGAERGDTLEIEVLELEPGEWGWTVVLPDLGLLADDFTEPFIRYFDIAESTVARLTADVRVPIAPFLGTMGTHPYEPIVAPPFPPHRGGGNIDTRHIVAGAKLWLPIWHRGAYFSCGDPHAAQGDGEVCVSAIECAMGATLRFNLLKRTLAVPQFRVPRSARRGDDLGGYHGTMGIDDDLMEGAKTAVRAMIEWIEDEHGLSREDAYVLCSLAGDLKILEIVDAGVWNVGFTLPLEVFSA